MPAGRHRGQHGDSCYGCRIRTVMVRPSAMPSRMNNLPPSEPMNGWERGIWTEERPGGYRIPVINSKGHPVSLAERQDHRHQMEEGRARMRSGAALAGRVSDG